MSRPGTYVGIDKELLGGMTTIGKTIRDGWVFGVLPETETCEGWNLAGVDALLQKVNAEWDKYGCLVCHLPPELRERHERIHGEAFKNAKAAGWSGEVETDDEDYTDTPARGA
ncbi:MAG: hypothetical protein OEM38_06555 [Gammaproteobacteria bacterium]|nr:hypothetical protein [Gammaproteobacteria bacterium]